MKMKFNFNHIFITGLVMGVLAAAAQAFFKVIPPVANGICIIGHPRDLVASLSNNFFGTGWPANESFLIYPALTVIGVVAGSSVSAILSKEIRLRPGPVRKRFAAFMFGFLVINFGLLWGACPIRTGLLISYGNIMALVALASIIVGVFLAILYVRYIVRGSRWR
jgi:vacuolar-type H+-ATPase subunit I/STV1